MRVKGDFETRSTVKLGGINGVGHHFYAEHPTTEVICLAVKEGASETKLWVAPEFRHLDQEYRQDLLDDELKFIVTRMHEWESHNCGFEQAIWSNIMVKRYGFPELPISKLRCSAAKAAVMALPRKLSTVCTVLQLAERKDAEGEKSMKRICKPRSPLKKERADNPDWKDTLYWDETPSTFDKLFLYCKQDVQAEYCLSKVLPELSPFEQKVWELDLRINNRGVAVDTEGTKYLLKQVDSKGAKLTEEALEITGGEARPSQRDASLKWLAERGVYLDSFTKDVIAEYLAREGDSIPLLPKRFLEIKQILGSNPLISKLRKADATHCQGRLKGLFLYAGARTHRWAGQKVQPQNLPRNSFNDYEKDVKYCLEEDLELVEFVYGDILGVAVKCIRPMLKAAEGHTFFCGDFASIESRVLSWLVGDERILDVFRAGKDIYKINASTIYNIPYDKVTKEQRSVGKVAELSLGYQGGMGAFMGTLESHKITDVDEIEAKEIIDSWRASRPLVRSFWYEVDKVAKRVIKTKRMERVGRIKLWVSCLNDKEFLHIKLPDGTILSYASPNVEVIDGYKNITFWGVPSTGDKEKFYGGDRKWAKLTTYGGKLTENIVQSLARRLLAEAMLRVEAYGFPIVMHVHDEIVCELPLIRNRYKSLEFFTNVLKIVPKWAEGLPIDVESGKVRGIENDRQKISIWYL